MKVMFICTGNICRSALAEGLLKKRLEELKITDMQVYSCGTCAEDGDIPTYDAIEVAEESGASIKMHRSTNIHNSNIEDMDLILCATQSHKFLVLNMYHNLKGKVYVFKQYVNYKQSENDIDILDPWGYDKNTYRRCADEINICIELLLQKIYNIY